MSIKCLKCENDALDGKALCKECFERHEAQVETEESEDWIKSKLESTRGSFRKKVREAQADTNKRKLFGLIVGGICFTALLSAFAAVMIFIPPDSPPSKSTSSESPRPALITRSDRQDFTFVRSTPSKSADIKRRDISSPEAPPASENLDRIRSIQHDGRISTDTGTSEGDTDAPGAEAIDEQVVKPPSAAMTPLSVTDSGGATVREEDNTGDESQLENLQEKRRVELAFAPSQTPTETPTETATEPPTKTPTQTPTAHPSTTHITPA